MRNQSMRGFLSLIFFVLLLGCAEKESAVIIVSKTLKKERAMSTAVPDEFSSFAPASLGYNVWVEGKVKNSGTTDVKNVVLSFGRTEGIEKRVLIAEVKRIPAGKTVEFKTRVSPTKYDPKFSDEEPEISYENE